MATDVVGLSRHCSLGFFPFSHSSLLAASTSSSLSCPARQVSRPYKMFERSCLLGITNGPSRQFASFKAQAAITETDKDQPKWWERNSEPNMVDVHSMQEFLSALSQAGDKLVIVEFYGSWCASCKALFPKVIHGLMDELKGLASVTGCTTRWAAAEHPEILFLKVNFDENRPMCKSLNVKVLPYFHFYRGADGQLESFSCSLAKFQMIKDAIQTHNTARCSIGPPRGVGNLDLESVPL